MRWRWPALTTVAAVLLAPALPAAAADEEPEPGYRPVERLNAGLPRPDRAVHLDTPQATLETFLDACRAGDFDRAAHTLNLNAFEPARQPSAGRELARELSEVMDQQVWFEWRDVPDRRDGRPDVPDDTPKDLAPAQDGPRHNFLLYRLFVGDRDFEIRLERVRPPGASAAWVFAETTVRQVPTLHREFRPSRLMRSLPAWLRGPKFAKVALWQWLGFAVLLLAGGLFGWVVQRALNFGLKRFDSAWARTVAEAIRGPGAMTFGLWAFYHLARRFLGLAGPILSLLDPIYVAIVVAGLVWFLQRLIRLLTLAVSRRYESWGDHDAANSLITRIAVSRHLLSFLVILGGGVYALSGFEWARRFGSTILASAGVAGIILGIAGQRVLGNLFAGLLLGTVQPVKAGDAIIFEGDFGWIEEIGITFLVIRTWDLRRLVVPLSYFMDHPFQNWSRGSQQLIKPVVVHADPRVDVDRLRAHYKEVLESTDLWDRSLPPILQVVDASPEAIAIRALCSARDPATSWDLHCLVRERLLGFLRDLEGGRFLPRRRVALVEDAPDAPADDRGPSRSHAPHGLRDIQDEAQGPRVEDRPDGRAIEPAATRPDGEQPRR